MIRKCDIRKRLHYFIQITHHGGKNIHMTVGLELISKNQKGAIRSTLTLWRRAAKVIAPF